MKFGPRRGNILIIFDKFLKNFGLLIVYLISFFFFRLDLLQNNYYFLIIALLTPVGNFINYFFTYYTIDEKSLIIEKGILTKKKIEIPIATITTVDLSQDILYQILNIYKLKIDNSSQVHDTADKAEASFALKGNDALFVKELLTKNNISNGTEKAKETNLKIKARTKDFFLLGLFQSKLIFFLTLLPVAGTVSAFFINNEFDTGTTKLIESALSAFGIVTLGAFTTIAVYFIALAVNIIISVVTYIDFTVYNTGGSVSVEYGLIDKKRYTLLKSKINGIILKQTILMRMFGYCSVEVFVIGYGDKSNEDKKEEAILYPLIKLKDVHLLLSDVLPEFSIPQYISHPPKKSFRYFFISVYFIAALILLAFSILIGYYIAVGIAAVLFALSVAGVIMEFKTTGIGSNKDNLIFTTGIFARNYIIVKTKAVESVSNIASVFKSRKGIGHIKIGFLAPVRVSNTKVRNVNSEEYEKIKGLIKY